jgi:DNA-binding LytR/AlgR family response regulator
MSTTFDIEEYIISEKIDDFKRNPNKLNSKSFGRRNKSTEENHLTIHPFKQSNFSENNFQIIGLPTEGGYVIVKCTDIIRCSAYGNYTRVYLTASRCYVISRSLKEFEDALDCKRFSRVHHSNLININHLEKYVRTDGGYVIMSDGARLSISRNKKEKFLSNIILI